MSQFCVQRGALPASLLNPPPAASSQDLNHLLTSNDLPLEFEIPHIRDIVSGSQNTFEAQMSALEEEILSFRPTSRSWPKGMQSPWSTFVSTAL
jgi:hypothetical protein